MEEVDGVKRPAGGVTGRPDPAPPEPVAEGPVTGDLPERRSAPVVDDVFEDDDSLSRSWLLLVM